MKNKIKKVPENWSISMKLINSNICELTLRDESNCYQGSMITKAINPLQSKTNILEHAQIIYENS